MFKKQKFNEQELALLFKAFAKKLFVRPIAGDIASAALNSGCCFYFKVDYYDKLKSDINDAYTKGKFTQSNASSEWQGLMSTFLSAEEIVKIDAEKFNDYYSEVGAFWEP
jgi:hypothetical protein